MPEAKEAKKGIKQGATFLIGTTQQEDFAALFPAHIKQNIDAIVC